MSALAKSALVAVGVPLALAQLWRSLPPLHPRDPWLEEGLWIRVVIATVGVIWLLALRSLARELRVALAGGDLTTSTSWSTRWAGAIATLVLLLSGAHLLGSSGSAHSPIAVMTNRQGGEQGTAPSSGLGLIGSHECLADLAERHLGTRDAWVRLAELNYGLLQTDGARLVDPSLLRAGWCILLPPDAQPGRVEEPSRPTSGRRRLEEPALLGLGIVTTAALVRRIGALRATAQSARNFGQRVGPRAADLSGIEQAVTPLGAAPLIDWIDAANRLLSMVALRQGVRPSVRVVRAGPNGVVFYLDDPVDCDATPFVAMDEGRHWRLPLTSSPERVRSLASGFARWAPWLIPLGDDGDDAWLLALAPGRWLSLVGPSDATAEILDGILVSLRTLPWAEELQVELLGLEPPAAAERCYQLVASSAAALAELLAEPPSARHDDVVAPWRRELLVVLGPDTEPPEVLLAARGSVGIVSIGEVGTDRLLVEEERCLLQPLGVELHVPRPGRAHMAQIGRLIERAAAEPYSVAVGTPLHEELRPLHEQIHLELLGGEPRAAGLEGLVASRDESRVTELLAYLALHDEGVARARLEAALFPLGGPTVPSRLAEVLAATRTALAAGSPRPGSCLTNGDHVALTVNVASDWVTLRRSLETAQRVPAAEARAVLEKALAAEPHPPSHPYRWMEAEGLTADLVASICDGWHQLGLLASAAGDLDAAEAAVRAGLQVEATSELLVRDLMVLLDAMRDRAGVLQSYESLESALVAIGGSEPTALTRQLFAQLTERSHRAS